MNGQSYRTTFAVEQTPAEVFAAVTDVRGWWSAEIDGGTERVGDEFDYHYRDVHRCTMKLTEVVPGERVVWRVLDNYFDFTEDKSEWKDTEVIFEISAQGGRTELHFTHLGLVPDYECYETCTTGWRTYIDGSLRSLITTGQGQPNSKED